MGSSISGILLIDKPEGVTSFDVVRRARRALKVRKIGHLGTLDPFATGLLPLCVGEATKLVPFLMPGAKVYRAVAHLGIATDTQDGTGQVVSRYEGLPTPAEIFESAAKFVGEILQTPPMYSALHHEGERLYKLARRGETVAVPPRKVTIYELQVEEVALPRVTLTMRCSQGAYIRTLAADLGAALGCGAHLAALRRLAVGSFKVEESLPLTELETATPGALRDKIIPLGACLRGLPQIAVGPEEARLLRQGRPLVLAGGDYAPGQLLGVGCDRDLVAVARADRVQPRTVLAPVRVFNSCQPSAISYQPKELKK